MMKKINISNDKLVLAKVVGGSGDIGLTDTDHMLPLYNKKGKHCGKDRCYLENPRYMNMRHFR